MVLTHNDDWIKSQSQEIDQNCPLMQTKYENFILNDKGDINKFSQNGNKATQWWNIQNLITFSYQMYDDSTMGQI